jgi:hypothetical protein
VWGAPVVLSREVDLLVAAVYEPPASQSTMKSLQAGSGSGKIDTDHWADGNREAWTCA